MPPLSPTRRKLTDLVTALVATAAVSSHGVDAERPQRSGSPEVLGRVWDRPTAVPVSPSVAPPVAAVAPSPPPDLVDTLVEDAVELPVVYALPAQPTAAPRTTPTGTGVWSVVIGIDDYPGQRHDLEAAVADADQVAELLDRLGSPASQRRVLRDAEAGPQSILAALDWLVDHAGPDATAIVFYAGHARATGGHESLVSADGTLIRDSVLADQLAHLAARRTWIAISACYGGGFTEMLAPGRILTAAAPADQRSYETNAYRASYLVEYMVRRALVGGAASESVQAAFAWAARELERDHPGRVPVQFERDAPNLSVFSQPPGVAPPAERPPPTPTPAPEPAPEARPEEPARDPVSCRTISLGVVTCNG